VNVRCLACGLVFDRALEMCPRRYLSPHDQAFMERIAELLDDDTPHKGAIQQALSERLTVDSGHEGRSTLE
jgi:hypothetical protein